MKEVKMKTEGKVSPLELIVILAVVPFCTWCVISIIQHWPTNHEGKGKYIAVISVFDRNGEPVNATPRVVCMAELTNETLICRVESVR